MDLEAGKWYKREGPLWWKGILVPLPHQLADHFFLSLNSIANKCSDKVVFGVVSWTDFTKSRFYLAMLQENHPSQVNQEIT